MTTKQRIARDVSLACLFLVFLSVCGAQEIDYAERIKGAWRTALEDGKEITLMLDGVATNPGTSLRGNSTYNIRGKYIVFAYNGAGTANEIESVSDEEMVMVVMRTGMKQTWVRRRVDASEPPTLAAQTGAAAMARLIEANEIALRKIQGKWKATVQADGVPPFDEIEFDMLHIRFPGEIDLAASRAVVESGAAQPGEELTVQSIYRLFAGGLDFNWKGRIVNYRVTFPPDGLMVWNNARTNQVSVFRRAE